MPKDPLFREMWAIGQYDQMYRTEVIKLLREIRDAVVGEKEAQTEQTFVEGSNELPKRRRGRPPKVR